MHLAESRAEAIEAIRLGGTRLISKYFDQTLCNEVPDVPCDGIVEHMTENHRWIVGINRLQEIGGGFGGLMILVAGPPGKRSWPATYSPNFKAR